MKLRPFFVALTAATTLAIPAQAANAASYFYGYDRYGILSDSVLCTAGHYSGNGEIAEADNNCSRRVYLRQGVGSGWAYCVEPYDYTAIPSSYWGAGGISVGAQKSCSEALTTEEQQLLQGASIMK